MSRTCVCRSVVIVSVCTGARILGSMSTTAPTNREIDAFRDRADRFVADLDEEYYLHFSGQKQSLDVEQVYERYEDLTRLETAQQMRGAPTELWRFACEGFLGNLTRAHQARLASVEAELEATVDGETIPYRMLRVAMSNEPDRDKRQRLEETRVRLLDEHLNPVYLEAAEIDRDAVVQLDAPNYYELYKNFGFRLDELAEECRSLLDETEKLWEREGDSFFRSRLGIGPRRRAPVGRGAALPRAGARPALPVGPDAARARGRRSPSSGSTCTRSRTSTSISTRARRSRLVRSARRSRCRAA